MPVSVREQPGLARLHYLRISACKGNAHAICALGCELLECYACDARCQAAAITLLERAAALRHVSAFRRLMDFYKARREFTLEYKWGNALVEMFLQVDRPLCAWEWIVRSDNRRKCSPRLELEVSSLQLCFLYVYLFVLLSVW